MRFCGFCATGDVGCEGAGAGSGEDGEAGEHCCGVGIGVGVGGRCGSTLSLRLQRRFVGYLGRVEVAGVVGLR